MPPTTQQVIDALEAMNDAPIPIGYKAVVRSAAGELARLKAERMKLDKRIHNQRVALRETWEIVEKRRKWLGSEMSRKAYIWLLKRYKALQAEHAAPPRS